MFGVQPLQQQQQQQQQLQLQQAAAPSSTQQFAGLSENWSDPKTGPRWLIPVPLDLAVLADTFSKMAVSLTRPQVYGDERDNVIAKLNQLLAYAGCGKGYYHSTAAPVDFTPDNPFCRFKAVGFNRLSGNKNEDGLLAFIVRKSASEVSNVRQHFIDGVYKIMGSKPNLSLTIESIRPLPNDKDNRERCEVVAFVTEVSPVTGAKRRIPALESYNFFSQPVNRTQLEQGLQIAELAPKVDPSSDKLEEYLTVPRYGIDWTVWTQAQRDNPDPKNLIPWPIVGFTQLRERQVMQQQEAQRQGTDLRELTQKIEQIEQKTLLSQSRLAQLKTAEDQLSHRVLKIVGTILRRSREGHALDANEELLQSRLENIFLRLRGPLQIKGRLSELLSQFRSRNYAVLDQTIFPHPAQDAALSSKFVDEVKTNLKKYQDGLEKLVETTQNDLKVLDVIEDAMKNQDRLAPRK